MRLLKPGWVAQDDHPIFSIDVHPSGSKFATGGQGDDCGRVTVWNMAPIVNTKLQKDPSVPKMLCQMDNHLACVNCVRWSNSGKYLASAGDDQRIILWTKSAYGGGAVFGGGGKINHESYKVAYTLRLHDGDVLDIAWSPGDVWLATASVDNTVVVWDVEKLPSTVAILKGHTGHVKGVTWDPVGKYLASQSADKTLRVWRTSDWTEDASITEPFEECGGTTHVLRLDWSPDGQYLVSAHAMNGGGPTAQILERDGWKSEKDFVGHRKAVTCVRFNDNIFEKELDNKKSAQFVCLAIGSRDRSMSVWLTSLKRPLFVIHDVFESSILDLAWSKDGLVLLACSMDGSVAAVVLNEKELGTPLKKDNRNSLLKKIYGQNIGLVQNNKPIMIENPEFLKLTQNGDDSNEKENESVATNGEAKASNSMMKRGPTDKQLEMMTSDGRRRITPIFILPTSDNSSQSNISMNGGGMQMQSSSRESKSKIVIEKLNGIVEPNVSPGKKSASPVLDKPSDKGGAAPTPKPNMIGVKHKPGPVTSNGVMTNGTKSSSAPQPPVNMIQVKKAPGKQPSTSAQTNKQSNTATETSANKKSSEDNSGHVKKKANRIESSSSDSDSSDSDSSSSSSDDETSQTSKSGGDSAKNKTKQPTGQSASKPGIMNNKRKADDAPSSQPAKKRGRPPGTATPIQTKAAPSTAPAPATKVTIASPAAPVTSTPMPMISAHPTPGLPPLLLTNNRQSLHFSQHKVAGSTLNIYVHNDYQRTSVGNLHKVSSHATPSPESPVLWDLILPAAVTAVLSSPHQLLISCRDATLHLMSASGKRQLPAIVFPAPPHKLSLSPCGEILVCVTTSAKMFLWKLAKENALPKIYLKNEDIGPLNRLNKKLSISISRISFNSDKLPILSLSDGSSHSYSTDLGCWLQLVSARSAATNIKLPVAANLANCPLAKLSQSSSGLALKLDEKTEAATTASSIETKLSSCLYLGSSSEYKYWLGCLVKNLARAGQETRLRTIFDDLLSPKPGPESVFGPGFDKRNVLREVLPFVATNMSLQRLYSEYSSQLKGNTDLFS